MCLSVGEITFSIAAEMMDWNNLFQSVILIIYALFLIHNLLSKELLIEIKSRRYLLT